jgi:hypothetical protein
VKLGGVQVAYTYRASGILATIQQLPPLQNCSVLALSRDCLASGYFERVRCMSNKLSLAGLADRISQTDSKLDAILAAIRGSGGNGQLTPAPLAAMADNASSAVSAPAPSWQSVETSTDETDSPQSTSIVNDAADLSPIDPPAPTETARPLPVGTLLLRRAGRGSGGNVEWSGKRGTSGLASCPLFDDSSRKVTVRVQRRDKTGATKYEDVQKSLKLDSHTRSVVVPLIAAQYKTVLDTEVTHCDRKAATIRVAQVDETGKAIPGTITPMLVQTADSGTLMLSGSMTVKVAVKDKTGIGEVVFTPAMDNVYLMGNSFRRIQPQ